MTQYFKGSECPGCGSEDWEEVDGEGRFDYECQGCGGLATKNTVEKLKDSLGF